MIEYLYLGRFGYDDGLRLQAELVELRRDGRVGNVLLLLEHPPVPVQQPQALLGERQGRTAFIGTPGNAWLARFHVEPRLDLAAALSTARGTNYGADNGFGSTQQAGGIGQVRV